MQGLVSNGQQEKKVAFPLNSRPILPFSLNFYQPVLSNPCYFLFRVFDGEERPTS